MSLKLEKELETKIAADKFFKIFKDQVSTLPKICPKIIQKVEVCEGDWDTHAHGSIKIWHYTVDNKSEVFKERVEYDDKKLLITLIGLEGDVFEHYETFNVKFQVVPKGPSTSSIIFTLEYEKRDGSTDPSKYLENLNKIVKDIESHLNNNNVVVCISI